MRNDLPPEGSAIDLRRPTTSSHRSISGSRPRTRPNRRDYLTRWCSRAERISGVQRRHLARGPRDAHLAQAGPDGGARHRAVDGAHGWRATTTCRPSDRRRIDGVGQSRGQYRSAHAGVRASSSSRRRHRRAHQRHRRRPARRRATARHVRFSGGAATFVRRRIAADGQHARRDRQGARGAAADHAQLPAGMKVGVPPARRHIATRLARCCARSPKRC